ncbi:MAG TPA: nucleoside-diphosphate sugar epimerase [Crenotrichaceae bacterium]|nr:nucleoside-diphosphate sugar epimerase [Crenotrichaceae bacterium]
MRKPNVSCAPLVWVLLGHKAGDNNQVLALAEALDCPFVRKHMEYRKTELFTNIILKTTLAGIKKKQSSELRKPWPDLVISAGRRNEPVAQWIKKQSGDSTKLIHLGRPWAALDQYDLIITTPQYQLPAASNVLMIDTVLHRVRPQRLLEEEKKWAPVLSGYCRPFLAVLVGGHSGAYEFDQFAARKLADQVNKLAESMNATVLVSTSARTPHLSCSVLEKSIRTPNYFFKWSKQQTDNPYLAFLKMAESFVVTGESVSMLTEACATGKPVYIFDFGKGADSMQFGDGNPGSGIVGAFLNHHGKSRWRILFHKLAMRFSSKRMQRNISAIHDYLITSGRAVWLGQPCPGFKNTTPVDSVDKSVEIIKQKFWLDTTRQLKRE